MTQIDTARLKLRLKWAPGPYTWGVGKGVMTLRDSKGAMVMEVVRVLDAPMELMSMAPCLLEEVIRLRALVASLEAKIREADVVPGQT